MPTYNLRNGVVLEDFAFKGQTNPVQESDTDFDKGAALSGFLRTSGKATDVRNPPQPFFSCSISAKVKGLSDAEFRKCSLRVIQIMELGDFAGAYYGAKPTDGATFFNLGGRLKQKTIDAKLTDNGQIPPWSPFQKPDDTLKLDGKYSAFSRDSPQVNLHLTERNKETKSNNFLLHFREKLFFETYAVFVHADGSRQYVEVLQWKYLRTVNLIWRKFLPEIDKEKSLGSASLVFDTGSSVMGKDAEIEKPISDGQVSNFLTNRAMLNLRTDPNVVYQELGPLKGPAPWDTFWLP
jgi:hypothetical protein